ncbi:hypothetical protein M2139_001515 [Enterococcus sp. PF1-24]|uniref:SpaA isopeptide-forming pilin-related protein n=1 Tax=unclassified Enterococcus TaxID=2608891 RepID=UPI0024734843|nr:MULTISPECIES: hypothetical protein [unclassified Enterococcus]MDH6364494.1 hypothetical protein [Enterococcus sp. PFB1-1]MDH6401629.1 hypothetical protein [Enterococcus sp. PF1-24]
MKSKKFFLAIIIGAAFFIETGQVEASSSFTEHNAEVMTNNSEVENSGKFVIRKFDNGSPLAGKKFWITIEDEDPVAYTTDEDGSIKIEDLTEGTRVTVRSKAIGMNSLKPIFKLFKALMSGYRK